MSLLRLLLVAACVLLLTAVEGRPQPGPGGGPGRGGGRGFGDPNAMFDRFANGKEVLRRSDLTVPFLQNMFDRMAEAAGITNGEMTRAQFTTAMDQMRAARGGGGPRGGGGGPPAAGNQDAGP